MDYGRLVVILVVLFLAASLLAGGTWHLDFSAVYCTGLLCACLLAAGLVIRACVTIAGAVLFATIHASVTIAGSAPAHT